MLHPYDAIIAETDSHQRAILLANEFKAVVVPRAITTLHVLLREVSEACWVTDQTFFGGKPSVEEIGEGWWMCSDCSDAIEAQPGVGCCPSCQQPIIARGLRIVMGEASVLLVPWTDSHSAFRVEAGVSFFGIPSKGGTKWTSIADGGETFEDDAWILALNKLTLNENGLRHDEIDPSTLFEVFELEKDGGYFKSDDLISYLANSPLEELTAIAGLIRDRFTFLPGGSWCPMWLEGDRLEGSPLIIVEHLLSCIKIQSLPHYNRWAGALLGHVLADRDVFEHDTLAMSRNMAHDLINVLLTAPKEDFDDVALELLLSSTERSVRSATGVEFGVDLFGLLLRLLSWDLSVAQRGRALAALVEFGRCDVDEEFDVLATYVETNVISVERFRLYAATISALPEATKGSALEALSDRMTR